MNRKMYRYLLYLGIGVLLYYVLQNNGEDGAKSLDQVHNVAPWIIFVIVILMMVMRVVKERKTKNDE